MWSAVDGPTGNYSWELVKDRGTALSKLDKIIDERQDRAEGILMVSHLEICRDYPSHFSSTRLKDSKYIQSLSKGQAIYFDLITKTFRFLPE